VRPAAPLPASLRAARLAGALSRAAGRGGGTTLPGRVLVALDPGAPAQLAGRLPLGSVLVSATNGKTTTCAMAAEILRGEIHLCRNAAGANLLSGVATALATGDDEGLLGLFEADEAALPGLADRLRPHTIALGNLFRDQLDRYGELEMVAGRWRAMVEGLDEDVLLVACADDPIAADLADGRRAALRYGIDDPARSLAGLSDSADSRWCVRCGTAYRYEAIWYGHLGDFRCPHCGHGRPALDVAARAIEPLGLDGTAFRLVTPMGERSVRVALPGLYNVENALAAATIALSLGVSLDAIRLGLGRFRAAFGRFQRIRLDDRRAVMLLVKNPAAANETLRTLVEGTSGPMTALVALNDRIADGRDVSWIWDAEWELAAPHLGTVVTSGTRAPDMALRLKYAGVPPSRLVIEPDLARAFDRVTEAAGPGGTAYLLPTYTAMLDLQRIVAGRGMVRPYWEEEPAA
jgi:lipid II isoglutaminyl synthase (glutamine-hydrolysing)